MVSIMNEALELEVGQQVLEVGAGCGWHAATVAEIVAPSDVAKEKWGHVFTVEIVAELANIARKNLVDAGFNERVTVVDGDGSTGYTEKAPYGRILATAAAPEVPQPLIEQLSVGGVIVLPVGGAHLFQSLVRVRKLADGRTKREDLGGVAFVPLTGRFGHRF
jgi:protein-L-isoaspartate(D-aspartate) O-methyltransferase